MPKSLLRIATRESPLALWQAEFVKDRLLAIHSDLTVEICGFTTEGDRVLDKSLAKIGGKGLFIKELEHALLNHEADLAVHSLKDVPHHMIESLSLAGVCERANPSDAFVSPQYARLADLPVGAVVGTSSLRRQAQLLAWRNDLCIQPLRGNLNTRMAKLESGAFDAIILASAGLERLGWKHRIREIIDHAVILPAVGQGALGLQIRTDDAATRARIHGLHHEPSAWCITAERAMNARLNGSCQVPIAGLASLSYSPTNNLGLSLTGLVAKPDGSEVLHVTD
ncbi:MAG: hydroxymethylbilane synthase, partial [Gammaproteobacteria bacterium]